MVKWMLIYALSVPSSDDLNAIQRGTIQKDPTRIFHVIEGEVFDKKGECFTVNGEFMRSQSHIHDFQYGGGEDFEFFYWSTCVPIFVK